MLGVNPSNLLPDISGILGSFTALAEGLGADLSAITVPLGEFGAAVNLLIEPVKKVGGELLKFGAEMIAAVTAARYFVKFIDPSSVMIFDQALKDLTAVVGVALIPVITQASKFLHQFGAVLYPITEALMPAVAEVMGSINDVFLAFLPAFSSFGGIVVDVARIFGELARDISTFLLPNIRSFTTVFAGIVSVVRTVLQSFAGLLGPNVRDGFKNLGQWLARFTTAIAGLIFKLLGMDAALGAMIASLQDGADKAGRKDAQGLAAAQNARLVGVADIGREALQRAFVASGIAGQDKGDIDDQEFRKRMVADLEAIRKGEGLKAIIVEAILAARQVIAPGEKLNDAAVGAARGAGNIAVGAGAGPLVMILKGLGIL